MPMWEKDFLYPESCGHHLHPKPQTVATCYHCRPLRNKFNLIHFSFDLCACSPHMHPRVTFAPLLNKNLSNQDKRKGFYKYSPLTPILLMNFQPSLLNFSLSMENIVDIHRHLTCWVFQR